MNCRAIFSASAALGAGLFASSFAWAQMADTRIMSSMDRTYADQRAGKNPTMDRQREWRARQAAYGYPSGYPYNYEYPYAYGYSNRLRQSVCDRDRADHGVDDAPASVATAPFAATTAATAPLVTGRSVATGQMGKMCSTPVKSCTLNQESWVGNGCSCKVSGGRSRGSVAP